MKQRSKRTDPVVTASVTQRSVDSLIPYAQNARTHSPEQILKIAASIKEFGFTNPILTDGRDGVIAGHGRLEAAKRLGLTHVPVIELGHLSGPQKRAYILADNNLALAAGWDIDVLQRELADLKEVDFDITLIGFDDIPDFVPDLPDDDEEKKENVSQLQLRVTFATEDEQQMLFCELRDRGFKVKV